MTEKDEKTQMTSATGSIVKQNDNTRGIPAAVFIEDVAVYVKQSKQTTEDLLKSHQELYGKYKFMETNLVSQQKSLLTKIPEIQSALQSLTYIIKKKDETINLHFELADSIYAKAAIQNEDKVLLWLGANVMLEYTYDEALSLLNKNLNNAQTQLVSLDTDLSFLKDQITISEVNIARLHNFNVMAKKEKK